MLITTKIEKVLSRIKEEQESIKDYSSLYSIFSGDEELTLIANLVSSLTRATNCHIESFEDLKQVLLDLGIAYKEYPCKTEYLLMNFCEILNWWNSEKYGYADEHDRFWKLQVITDSDFIPYKSFTEEEYHIVYDVLYNDACGSTAYDVVASYYNKYKTPIGRKVALMHWCKCFQKIIDALNVYKEKAFEGDVCVYIPFLDDYKQTATHTIEVFEMAKDAAILLRDTDVKDAPIENPDDIMAVDDMETIFTEWMDRLGEETSEEGASIIYDEMIRRGLCPNTKICNSENKYRTYIIGAYEESPAENKHVSLEEQKEKSIKDRAAIIYYMLKDDVETSVIQKIIHYVCKPTKEYKGANPSDTIYTYVAHPEKSFLDKADRIDYIKETLKKYHFDEEYINKNIK